MTIRSLISNVRTSLKEASVDSVLTNREIWNLCWEQALLLFQREADTKRNLFNLNIFTEITVRMKAVSIIDEVPVDCTIYRSIDKIPALVESKFGLIYRFISTLDKSQQYNLVTPQAFKLKIKITKGRGKYVYVENGYLYSTDKYPLIISGLFSNVKDLLKIKGGCKVMNLELPIPTYHLTMVEQMTIDRLKIFKSIKQDTDVNANPNL